MQRSIVIEKNAKSGNTKIPAGDYKVSVREYSRTIFLEGANRDIEIHAIGRPSRNNVRTVTIQFAPGGGPNSRTLLVKTPRAGEFLAQIDYELHHAHA